ncbi:SHOCT domain-containing protein [Cellulomonas sp.]|uniref:SHOCT domain-containing protein n=1 Tax=Cellulomonas sp. TaxID=40001 RepID=UPI0025832194|nr:SHOCT domain-containing protein [Cellulomonas sp.]MCR6689462.1 SHOCT domain-containing protein [Cellulomonas sp.]
MTKNRKPPVAERLARYPLARDLGGAIGRGVDKLPVGEVTRATIKIKSGEVVAAAAETSAALAAGAGAAVKAGRDGFVATRDEQRHAPSATPAPAPGSTTIEVPAPASLVDQLERLQRLHTQGHLSDDEYAHAKAALLAP